MLLFGNKLFIRYEFHVFLKLLVASLKQLSQFLMDQTLSDQVTYILRV